MKSTFLPSRLAFGVALACGLSALPSLAATDAERLQALEQRLERSLAVIEQLSRRLAELEKPPAAAAASPTATATSAAAAASANATQQRIESLERQLGDVTTALGNARHADDTGLPLHGFMDVGWSHSGSRAAPGTRNGFKLGTLDFYLTPQFGPNVRSLIELAFEYDSDGGLATDLERMQIGYAFSDELVLWGGRFHTPYGYWNTAFHHGAQIQTSITRPRFIAFEDQGGILPGHSVGLWANGKQNTALGKLGYDVYITNGNRISQGVLDFNAGGDDNAGLAAGFNLSLSPRALPGLTLGVHGLRQTVAGENADASASGRARAQMLGGYLFFENDDWEVIGEGYRFRNRNLAAGGGMQGSWAAFLQVGRSIAPRWVGFVRAEKAQLSAADPYFSLQESGSSYHALAAGLRYELDPRASLKLQLDRNVDAANASQAVNTLRAQYAIRF